MKTVLLQVPYLGHDKPSAKEQVCLRACSAYARKHGMEHIEIGLEPMCGGDAQWIPSDDYINHNADLKETLSQCEFTIDKRAQLTSDLIRFHYAANFGGRMLYVDRDAFPMTNGWSGAAYAAYGANTIDQCVFFDDDPYRMRWLYHAMLRRLPVLHGMTQVAWPSIHGMVNELMLKVAKRIPMDRYYHMNKTRREM